MNCPNCGASVQAGSNRCFKCGSFVEQTAPPQAQVSGQPVNVVVQIPGAVPQAVVQPQPVQLGAEKSKVAAGLLGIFLGYLGVHRFYLGYTGIGVAQLILTLTGIFTCWIGSLVSWVWGLVEGIMIFAGSINKDAAGRPLKS